VPVSLETRFAPSADGPVPFRVDGADGQDILVVSDWGAPYGAPGQAAFDAFARSVAERGARIVTVLDGTVGATTESPETARRIAAIRAVADAADVNEATLLGVADGAPAAAALAASGSDRIGRVVLFDVFAPERRDSWGAGAEVSRAPGAGARAQDLQTGLRDAESALGWVRGFWQSVRAEVEKDPDVREIQIPESAAEALKPWLDPEGGGWPTGIAGLLGHISRLEGAETGASVSALTAITVPVLILEARPADPASTVDGQLGLEVASRIPGSRHRTVPAASRWPWGSPELLPSLLDVAPAPAAERPRPAQAVEEHADRVLATVLFTDIVGSTERLTELGDAAWRDLLSKHNEIVRANLARSGGREIDNAGDGFLAAFEMPARAVRCAMAVRDEVQAIGLAIRAGLHTGECERIGQNLVGIAVHIGARIAAQAGANQILASATVRDLIAGSGIGSVEHGVVTLKGVPGEWLLYELGR
jgi:class 3 adenylate cyclase/pimeloyl-ACP methyl ester carboxylesterase